MVGDLGLCSVCGFRPAVVRLRVSDNFVSYSELFAGGGVCEVCSRFFSDRRYRSSSWVLVGDEVRVLGRGEVVGVLRSPPENGLVYVKSSGRKYGFLRCLRLRSTKSVAVVCGEDEGFVVVPREKLARVVDVALTAYRVLKRKSTLLSGCSASDWIHEDVCRAVEVLRGEPLWQIVVRAL